MTKKKIVYLGEEKIQIKSNPKVNKTKAKKVEVADIEPTPEPKPKKDPRPLTDEEKAERAPKARRQENEWRELIAEKRRPLIAKALWKMYQMGELIPQHIKYKSDIGEIDQQFLYSHKSRFAI